MAMYEPVIGIEVHCELKTASKMFCACPNRLEAEPNTNVCPICLGHPGTLPTANVEAVRLVVAVGLALDAAITPVAKFDRKNYFYPDLPKGYQISQYDQPLTTNGRLEVDGRTVRITRVHLEEDTAKLTHPSGASYSLVDFNRAGVPLLELVTEPDLVSAAEARRFCQELQLVLRAVGASDADMERGQMRCEANISLLPAGTARHPGNFGTKVEVKNLNSFRAVERAIVYEIKRQTALLEAGHEVTQETRGWDDGRQETYPQRAKESAHDYRYFPEPDLPPIVLDQPVAGVPAIDVAALRRRLPELPQAKRRRFQTELGLDATAARLLSADRALADYAERTFSELVAWVSSLENVVGSPEEILERERSRLGKLLGGWLTTELFKLMNEGRMTAAELKVSPENFAEFLSLIYQRRLNSSAAQLLLKEMFETGKDPSAVLEERDLGQVSDPASLDTTVDKVIAAHPAVVADYRRGKTNAIQFLVGQAMREARGKANPETLHELLAAKLAAGT